MSRLGYLTRHPKRSLGALSTLLVAAGLTVGSTAYFQDTEESAQNSVSTGGVNIEIAGSAAEVVDALQCSLGPSNPQQGSTAACINTGVDSFSNNGADPATTFKISNLSPTNVVPVGSEPNVPGGGAQAGVIRRHFKIRNPTASGALPVHVWMKVTSSGNQDLLDQANIRVFRVDNDASGKPALLRLTNGDKTFSDFNGDVFPADIDTAPSQRDRLDPGKEFEYEVQVWLPENNQSQNDLQNKSISSTIKLIARSVDSVDPVTTP